MNYRETFDYGKMAQEAARERDMLHAMLERRKSQAPPEGQLEMAWQRENGMLYNMYLEQRGLVKELERRDAKRKEVTSYVY